MGYDLVAIAGPVEGERFSLDSSEETIIGRTQRGINLPDPLVSVNHAKVVYEGGVWLISDLDSATGTKLNGEALKPEKPVELDIGDVILIGECEFRLDSSGNRVVRRLLWAMLPAWLLVIIAAAVLYWASGDGPVSLALSQEVRTFNGATTDLVVPKPFIRQHGIDVNAMRLRRITDFDENGVDEMWLYVGDWEMVITFGEKGWSLLGKIPKGCVDRKGEGFPDLHCKGLDFRMLETRYTAVAQVDPVVWFIGEAAGEYEIKKEEPAKRKRKKKRKSKEGDAPAPKPKGGVQQVKELGALRGAPGPVPFRISMGKSDLLAGFLASHGISEPVHYIICENAFLGIPAQALLEGGRIRQLAYGCQGEMLLKGERAAAFEGAEIAAVALTTAGREMLARHLSYTWSGAPEPLFLNNKKRAMLKATSQWPIELKGGVYLSFDATGHIFHPLAREPVVDERIRLISEQITDVEAITASLLSRGRAKMDPDGCAELTIRTGGFRCALMRGCYPGKRFIQVVESGCGSEEVVLNVGYSDGIYQGATKNTEVRVQVVTQPGVAVTDVIHARVGARPVE